MINTMLLQVMERIPKLRYIQLEAPKGSKMITVTFSSVYSFD